MQDVVIARPYEFVPPIRSEFWTRALRPLVRPVLKRGYGVESLEYRGLEHLQQSLDAGHGIVLAPNHCRPHDPLTVGTIVLRTRRPLYVMASWHLFVQSRFHRWLYRRCGGFSVYREGPDRQAISTAIDTLVEGRRPLVLFAEGAVTRTNDLLNPLLEGTSFVARTAAKKRAKSGDGRVVVHPVALKYLFRGDVEATLSPVLRDIERRLSWQPLDGAPLLERVYRVARALLTLKELEYLGEPQSGSLSRRVARLTHQILAPLEREWIDREDRASGVVARVKRLRSAIVPGLAGGKLDEAEQRRRWRQLADIYLAQALGNYPPDYLGKKPTPERVIETVERFEEDLTDKVRTHRPWHAVVQIGEAIEVSPERVRGADPVLEQLERSLRAMLEKLAEESGDPLPVPDSLTRADEEVTPARTADAVH